MGSPLSLFACIGSMNRSESPSTALRAPSPPLGEKDGMRGNGSWKVPSPLTMPRCSTSLAVGFRPGGLGFGFWRRFGLRFRSRFRVAAGGRRSRGGLLPGGFLVTFAAVIGDVKAAALENDPSAGDNGAFDFAFAPAFPAAFLLRTDYQGLFGYRL